MANDTPSTQDPFQEAEQNPLPAAQTPFQRLNAGSGIPMIDEALKRDVLQKQAQANLYHKNAADINGLLFHLADPEARKSYLNPQTGQPYSDDDIQQLQSQLEHATGQYEKLVGVDKESKGALQKARTIIDFIHGKRREAMTPPPTPDYPTNVSDAGVTTSGVTTPRQGPVATPSSFATNVGDSGVSYDQSKAQQLTPPPLSPLQEAARASAQLPFSTHPAKVGQAIADSLQSQQAQFKQQHDEWKTEADKLFDPNSREYKWYAATGKLPPIMRMQKGPIVKDANGIPVQSIFSPEGEYLNPDTMEKIEGAQPMSPADLRTATINLMTPDGPRTMFRKGNKVYDNHGNLQDGELVPFIRGMVPTTTDREVMGFDEQGNPTKYLLRSTRTINMGPTPSPMATPPAGGTGTAAPSTTGGTAKGRMPAPPKPGTAPVAQGSGSKTGKAVFPAGQFMQFSKSATGVDQARNSLVGDNIEKGQVSGLAKDLDIFKDQSAVARIGEYLQLVHNLTAREGDSFAQSDDTVGAVKWFAGMPQAVIGLQQGALRDKYNSLTTADKKFVADYFRAMGTMGGMRASTGMPGYQWSFTNMYNEMPTPGKVTDYDDAVRRLMNYVNETNVVSKRNPMVPKVDIKDAERQIRGGGTTKGGMNEPPKPGSKAVFF